MDSKWTWKWKSSRTLMLLDISAVIGVGNEMHELIIASALSCVIGG